MLANATNLAPIHLHPEVRTGCEAFTNTPVCAGLPLIQVFITSFCLFCFCLFFVLAALRLSCLVAGGIFVPRPWMETMFPVLEDGFLTIGPLEKCPH